MVTFILMGTLYSGKCSCSVEPVMVEQLSKYKSWSDDMKAWHWVLYVIFLFITLGGVIGWALIVILSKDHNYKCASCGNKVEPKNLIKSI
jgi:hypothetical protein